MDKFKGENFMPSNELVEKPKLNIFQQIRKLFLVARINGKKYEKAPEYLKTNPEVVDALISNIPTDIQYVRDEIALQYLNEHPETIKDLGKKLQTKYIAKNQSLAEHLSNSQKTEIIFGDENYELIKYLPKELQLEFLTNDSKPDTSRGVIHISPKFFTDKLQCFDEDILIQAVAKNKQLLDMAQEDPSFSKKEWLKILDAREFYEQLNFENLPVNTQLKLALLDDTVVPKMTDEAVIKYVNNNPLFIAILSNNQKKLMIEKNPQFIAMLERPKIEQLIPYGESEKLSFLDYSKKTFNDKYLNLDYDEVLKISTLSNDNYSDLWHITDSIRDKDLLWKISKTIPQALFVQVKGNKFAIRKKIQDVVELFNQKITNPNILEAIKSSRYLSPDFEDPKDIEVSYDICKVLTDEKLLATADQSKIIEFIQKPSIELMKELIIQTYGENARKVLEARPNLGMKAIPNLRIFDSAIFENFGEGVVHNQFNYDTKFSILLADFANHPERIAEYKKFERLTDGFFINNAAGNEEKIKSFVKFSDLIKTINEEEMTPERINALKLALLDRKMPESKFLPLKSIEDLDNYTNARNQMYDEAMQKVTDIKEIREILSKRFFGMPYLGSPNIYTASSLALDDMVKKYSIDNLLKDRRTQESELLNNDELDAIELASIISKIDDIKVLRKLYSTLASNENVIGPVDFETIKQKIPLQYSKELVSQLLKPEDAIRRAESGEDGISIEHEEDGVDIIRLNGADFKILMHSVINARNGDSNSHITTTPTDDTWKNMEEGCSTISNCLIEPGVLESCAQEGTISYGFASIDPNLIIGMSQFDSRTTHLRKQPAPNIEVVEMNYPEELLRKTAEQNTAADKYNEVVTYRYEQNPDLITSENNGGKIMPDYIIAYGKATGLHRTRAKEFSKNNKPIPIIEIDVEAYKRKKSRNMRAKEHDEEHKAEPREDSKFIQEVKKVTEEDQLEDR